MSYNGWTNYETWCVNLWLSNEERMYRHCRKLAGDCKATAPTCPQVIDGIWNVDEATKFLLADQLKELIEEGNPIGSEANLYSDLLNAALSEVDWREVAEAFLEE